MLSKAQYQNLCSPKKSLNLAILDWRRQLEGELDVEFNNEKLELLRKESNGREFLWGE